MSESTPPPGWYEDPYGAPGLLRHWDGRQWTQVTMPAGGSPPPTGTPPTRDTLPYGSEPERRPAGRPGALPWLVAGSVLGIVAVVAAAILFLGDDGGGRRGTLGEGSPSPTPATSSPAPAGRSPVVGTVTDATAHISYARLGAPWVPADPTWLRPGLFSAGEVSVVQAPFEQYASFNATSLSGVPRSEERAGYTGPKDLPAVARRVTARIVREHFALAARRTTVASADRTVDGHPGRLERFRLDFTDARARGWRFTADTVAILVVDTGGGRLAELWVSVPDTFPGQGDLDAVLDSVKVSQ